MRRAAWALLLAGALSFAPVAHADPLRGERVFQRCFACHSVVAGENKLPGPNLKTVIGRRAASVAGFDYSPEMRAAAETQRLVWTRTTLDAFLADPQTVIPGTTMQLLPPLSPDERRDVIDYLESAAAR